MKYLYGDDEDTEMTYYESSRGIIITKARAIKELEDHCIDDIDSFFNEMGNNETYVASEVLEWLGY